MHVRILRGLGLYGPRDDGMRRVRRMQTRPQDQQPPPFSDTYNFRVPVHVCKAVRSSSRDRSSQASSDIRSECCEAQASGWLTRTAIVGSHSSNQKSTKERGQGFQATVSCLPTGSLGPWTLSTQCEVSSAIFT